MDESNLMLANVQQLLRGLVRNPVLEKKIKGERFKKKNKKKTKKQKKVKKVRKRIHKILNKQTYL